MPGMLSTRAVVLGQSRQFSSTFCLPNLYRPNTFHPSGRDSSYRFFSGHGWKCSSSSIAWSSPRIAASESSVSSSHRKSNSWES